MSESDLKMTSTNLKPGSAQEWFTVLGQAGPDWEVINEQGRLVSAYLDVIGRKVVIVETEDVLKQQE